MTHNTPRSTLAGWTAAAVLAGLLTLTGCGTETDDDPDDCITTAPPTAPIMAPAAFAKTSKPKSKVNTSKPKATKTAQPTAKATTKKPGKPKHHDLDDLDFCDD